MPSQCTAFLLYLSKLQNLATRAEATMTTSHEASACSGARLRQYSSSTTAAGSTCWRSLNEERERPFWFDPVDLLQPGVSVAPVLAGDEVLDLRSDAGQAAHPRATAVPLYQSRQKYNEGCCLQNAVGLHLHFFIFYFFAVTVPSSRRSSTPHM